MLPDSIKAKKRRLIVCTGYFSILNTVVTLRQIGGRENSENILIIAIDSMDAESLKAFAETFNIFDTIYISPFTPFKCFPDVKSKVGNNFFDEVMLPYPLEIEKYIRTSTIVFTDEGGTSYINLNDTIVDYYAYNYKAYLIDSTYLHGCDNIKNIEINEIDKSIYNSVLANIENKLILKDNSVLFLGSRYSSKKKGESFYDVEDALIMKEVINKGYNVYYKLHPRNSSKSVSHIIKAVDSSKLFIIDSNEIPLIESILFYNKDKIKFLIGKASSTLYFSYNLFNIPAFTILIKEHYDSANLKYLFPLKYLPDIKDFLNSKLDPISFYNEEKKVLNKNLNRFAMANNRLLLREKEKMQANTERRKFRKKVIKAIAVAMVGLVLASLYYFNK